VYVGNMGKRNSSAAVIGYLRVSTEEQATSGLGLADQRAAIAAEAQRKGWKSVEYVTDDGYSAKSLARPGISDVLDRLRAGKAGVLVVSKLDRLSRSLLDFASLMAQAEREGWQLVVLDMAIDTTTPSGALMANVMASFAEYERRIIGARTSAAMQQLKAQGKRLGRPRVMAQDVTERIVSEREEGKTLTAIAEGLNADEVPTARGGARWYPSTVKAVLTSASLDAVAVA
jgi:DNA invertase Pin-like site-specific DNA recombinase